jgi:hypothetical protein
LLVAYIVVLVMYGQTNIVDLRVFTARKVCNIEFIITSADIKFLIPKFSLIRLRQRLRMSGGIPPLSHTPLWRVQG